MSCLIRRKRENREGNSSIEIITWNEHIKLTMSSSDDTEQIPLDGIND